MRHKVLATLAVASALSMGIAACGSSNSSSSGGGKSTATGDSWSNAGKTLTLTTRTGVKWNDGKPFSAADVAFTFNMLKSNPKLNTNGAPVVTSASAPSATTAVLNFKSSEYANLFLIGQVYIV